MYSNLMWPIRNTFGLKVSMETEDRTGRVPGECVGPVQVPSYFCAEGAGSLQMAESLCWQRLGTCLLWWPKLRVFCRMVLSYSVWWIHVGTDKFPHFGGEGVGGAEADPSVCAPSSRTAHRSSLNVIGIFRMYKNIRDMKRGKSLNLWTLIQ